MKILSSLMLVGVLGLGSLPALAEGGGDEFPGQRRGGGTHVTVELEDVVNFQADSTRERPGDSARPSRGNPVNK